MEVVLIEQIVESTDKLDYLPADEEPFTDPSTLKPFSKEKINSRIYQKTHSLLEKTYLLQKTYLERLIQYLESISTM